MIGIQKAIWLDVEVFAFYIRSDSFFVIKKHSKYINYSKSAGGRKYMISYISSSLIPILFFMIVFYGWRKKQDVYQEFLKGVGEGFKIVLEIAPTLIGLFMAVNMVRTSGAMEVMLTVLRPIGEAVKFPVEVIPVVVAKLFSSSAATGILLDLYNEYGTDSLIGFTASLILSSTETVFYTMSVYFMYVGIKKTRWTLPGALLSMMAGTIASILIGQAVFS